MTRVKVNLEAWIPRPEIEAFMQVIRGWERGRPEIDMAVLVDDRASEAGGGGGEEAGEIMKRLAPQLPIYRKWPRELAPLLDDIEDTLRECIGTKSQPKAWKALDQLRSVITAADDIDAARDGRPARS